MSLDNKLSFKHHVVNVCKKVPFSVRLQFFKTFILPLFDYCLSLVCYFSKSQIQTLANCFNACLFKLFNSILPLKNSMKLIIYFKVIIYLPSNIVVLRLSLFAHKIINIKQAPVNLKNQII